jgi:putative transposase
MSRGSDGEKVKLWRDRFRRYAKSAHSVEDFCRGEGVSAATFYHWRKKLVRAPGRRPLGKRDAFRPVMVTPAVAGLSVRLPGGAELEVPRENLDAIRAVVAELVRSQYDLTAGDGLC